MHVHTARGYVCAHTHERGGDRNPCARTCVRARVSACAGGCERTVASECALAQICARASAPAARLVCGPCRLPRQYRGKYVVVITGIEIVGTQAFHHEAEQILGDGASLYFRGQ